MYHQINMEYKTGIDYAYELDNVDPLATYKNRFYIPNRETLDMDGVSKSIKPIIYMDGNSLGLASKDVEDEMKIEFERWKNLTARRSGVDKLTAELQAQLVGAEPDEVTVTGGASVNIHAARAEDQIKTLVNLNKESVAREAISSSSMTLRTSIFDALFGFAVIIGLFIGVNQWVISPITQLGSGIQSFAEGSLSEKIPVRSNDEIGQLASAFNQMTTQINEKIDTITNNEKMLAELNNDLESEIQMREKYEKEMLRVASEAEVDRMRSQFLSTITHELRTPLTSIKGYTEILRQGWVGEVPPAMDEVLAIIIRNTDRLASLTCDLLDVQRITSGRLEVELHLWI